MIHYALVEFPPFRRCAVVVCSISHMAFGVKTESEPYSSTQRSLN